MELGCRASVFKIISHEFDSRICVRNEQTLFSWIGGKGNA